MDEVRGEYEGAGVRLFKMQVLLPAAVLCVCSSAQANWVTHDFPGATGTDALGIDGGNIVGDYWDDYDNYHGFLYDGVTSTTLDFPGAIETYASGIQGGSVVGDKTFI